MNSITEKKEYNDKIVNIRALAIFLVVLGHSIILYSSSWNLYETTVRSAFFDHLKSIINVIQMPLFFSVSGFLFFYSHNKHRGFLHLIKSKIQRLLIPYLSVALLYMIPIRLLIHYPGYEGKNLTDMALLLFKSQDVGHLWFLPTLFFIFVVSEIVLDIIERFTAQRVTEILFMLTALVLYFRGYLICMNYSPLLTACTNIPWFAFGYILCRYRSVFSAANNIYVRAGLMLICFVLLYVNAFRYPGVLLGLFTKLIILFCFYGCAPGTVFSKKTRKLAGNSFGIYLFHSPLIYITFSYFAESSPLIVVSINLFVFGMAAFLLTDAIRKTPLKRMIGE